MSRAAPVAGQAHAPQARQRGCRHRRWPAGQGHGSAVRHSATGLALTAGVAGWTGLSAWHSGGRAGPLAALCLTCAVAWAIGSRSAGTSAAHAVPGLVAAAGVVVLATPGFWTALRSPLGPPLGYANANAALFVQAEVAALMLFASASRPWHRMAAGTLAGVFALVPVLIGSVAASGLALGVAAAAALRRAAWVPAACAVGLALAVAATVAVGAMGVMGAAGDGRSAGAAGGTQTMDTAAGALAPAAKSPATVERLLQGNRRPVLWGEAFSIMAHRPLWGAGPQRFAETAPTALADPDAAWAHNAFLQQGAETGVPGLVLLAALFAWALAQTTGGPHLGTPAWPSRVGSRPPLRDRRAVAAGQARGMAAIGAAGVAALGMHATVDYVLHFPAVPVAGALLAGFAAGRARPGAGWASRRQDAGSLTAVAPRGADAAAPGASAR